MKTDTQENKVENKGRVLRGVVVSNKMKDTVSVLVERYVKDPKYKKYAVTSKKYMAHAPGNTLEVGDKVSIKECRPLSKKKSFIVV